jgi:hypothetical protein
MPLATPSAYIVCLDLKTSNGNYTPLYAALQGSSKWFHHLTWTWIVVRYETLDELQKLLVPLIFYDDRLLILPARGPAGGWLPQEAWDWIRQNVPNAW